MSSKLLQSIILMSTLFVASCSLPLNEKPSTSPKPEAKLGFDSKCLKDAGTALSRWADGTATRDSLNQSWSCLETAIELFKSKVVAKQRSQDEYAPEDIAAFFQGYVFKETRFSKSFLSEVMVFKQLLVGGGAEKITRAELDKLKVLMSVGRELTLSTLESMPILTLSWKPSGNEDADVAQYDRAEKSLSAALAKVAGIIEGNGISYDLNRIPVLFSELEKVADKQWTWIAKLQKYIPLLISAKNLYFKDASPLVEKTQYRDLFSVGAKFYARYGQYHYFLKPAYDADEISRWMTGAERRWMGRMVSDGLSAIQEFVDRRAEKNIEVDELMKVWMAARAAGLISDDVKDETVKNLAEVLFRKVLMQPEDRIAGVSVNGLTVRAFDYLRSELGAWYAVQAISENLFGSAVNFKKDQMGLYEQWKSIVSCVRDAQTAKADCSAMVPADAKKYVQDANILKSSIEMQRMFSARQLLSHTTKQRVVIGDKYPEYGLESLRNINFARLISRVLIQGYASTQGKTGAQEWLIDRPDIDRMFKDFKPIGVELDFIEADNDSFASLRFTEGNLFVPQSDGSDLLDVREGTGLITFIMSGLSHNSAIEKRIREVYCRDQIKPGTLKKLDLVPVACLVDAYRKELGVARTDEPNLAVTLPQFSQMMSALPMGLNSGDNSWDAARVKAFDAMMFNLMKASGWKDDGSKMAVMKDISLIAHVAQYIESVMQRFDGVLTPATKDGVLNYEEAMHAYPLFRGTINWLLKKSDDASLLLDVAGERVSTATFGYVLHHGNIPACSADNTVLIHWAATKTVWKKIAADRSKLAEILGIIAETARRKPGDKIPPRCIYGEPDPETPPEQ